MTMDNDFADSFETEKVRFTVIGMTNRVPGEKYSFHFNLLVLCVLGMPKKENRKELLCL